MTKKPCQCSAAIWYLKTHVNTSYFSCFISVMLPVAQDVLFQPGVQIQTIGLVQLPWVHPWEHWAKTFTEFNVI